jgi:hypothetical protein
MIEVFRNGIGDRGIRLDGKSAHIRNSWYAIANYSGDDLGLPLTNVIKGLQIEVGSKLKASLLFTVGLKDNDLYVVVLDLEKNLRTTYILKKDAASVEVETEKYNPKIPFFYGKKNLDPIPKEDLYKTFFGHFKLGVGPVGWRGRYDFYGKKWGYFNPE